MAVFIALMLVGPSKCLKQIIQIKLNRVRKPNWPEANQLAIYKRGRGFELVTTVNESSKRSWRDLNSGPPNGKFSALTTQPHCFLKSIEVDSVDWSSEAKQPVASLVEQQYNPKLGQISRWLNVINYSQACWATDQGRKQSVYIQSFASKMVGFFLQFEMD